MVEPTLKNYIARYRMDTMLLSKHPESKELLIKRIEQHKKAILDYVTSDHFYKTLDYMNL
mgnify:CR=1 FL=1|jgi:hypothetical protein